MARLPSFEDLGQVTPQPQAGVDVPLADASAPAEALAGVGGEVAKLGDQLNRNDYYQGTLQMRYAQAGVASQQQALMEQLAQDPDYASIPQKYQDGMQQIIKDNSAQVENPYHNSLFQSWATKTAFAPGERRVQAMVAAKSKDAALSSLDQLTNDQISVALRDPTQTQQSLQNIQGAYQATVQAGGMDQAHATLGLQKVTQQLAVARVNYMPPAQALGVLQPMMDRMQGKPAQAVPDAQAANANAPADADSAINFVMNKFEGDHLVPNDNGRGPSKYGIVAADNGLTPQQVANLLPDKAAAIYKQNYWDAIGADNLPANMRLAAFDTAVNFGVPVAQDMIAKADGDPNALLAERAAAYQHLVQMNPGKYGASAAGWASRQTLLGQTINNTGVQPVSNDWTDFIPPEKVPELFHTAVIRNAQDLSQQKQALDQAQEKTMNGMLTAAYQQKLDPQTVINDPTLTFEKKQTVLNMLHSVAERGAQTDPAVFNDLFQRIHADPTDPNRITKTDDLIPYVGHGISFEGNEQLRKELAGRNTPEGDAEAQMKKQFFDVAKSQISGSDPLLHIKDPKGEELYLKFMSAAVPAYQQGREAGKTPTQLLNPDSPDYVGKLIPQFKRGMNEKLSDMMLDAGGMAPDAAATPTLGGIISDVHSGKISEEEGRAKAESLGLVRIDSAPKVPTGVE